MMTEFFNVTLRFPIRSLYAVIVNFFGQSVGTLEKISLSILKELTMIQYNGNKNMHAIITARILRRIFFCLSLKSVYIVSSFEIVFKYINATINRQINNTFAAAAPSPKWNVWKDSL